MGLRWERPGRYAHIILPTRTMARHRVMTGAWDSPIHRHSQLRAVGHSSRMYRMQVRVLTAGESLSDFALYLFHIGFFVMSFWLIF